MKHLHWLFFPIFVVFVLVAIWATEILATSAIVALISTALLMWGWARFLPRWLKYALTTGIGLLTIELGSWYVGWGLLANSIHGKVAFVMVHLMVIPLLLLEQKRLRGTLWKRG